MPACPLRPLPCLALALALASGALLAGCGDEPTGAANDAGDPTLGTAMEAISANNGMSQNGMSQNGMSQNGMSQNGMSQNGFGTTAFRTWFNTDPVLSDVVMKYLARCAAAAGKSYSWTNPSTGKVYTWAGSLGLAPGFAAGAAPTVAEQQVLTACLAAHVNKYGQQVPIAIEGRGATGTQIPISTLELTTYSVREGCFFGNVFAGEGVYSGIDHSIWAMPKSSARACAFDTTGTAGPSPECSPVYFVGACSDFCTLDATKTFFENCSWNGKSYRPLTTRLRPAEIYTCGDGVCQVSERCGSRSEWWQCRDCGPCP